MSEQVGPPITYILSCSGLVSDVVAAAQRADMHSAFASAHRPSNSGWPRRWTNEPRCNYRFVCLELRPSEHGGGVFDYTSVHTGKPPLSALENLTYVIGPLEAGTTLMVAYHALCEGRMRSTGQLGIVSPDVIPNKQAFANWWSILRRQFGE